MAKITITNLPTATALTGAEEIPVQQGGLTKKSTVNQIVANQSVTLTGDQTVAGVKTFNSSPIVPTPSTSGQATTKGYVDGLDGQNVKLSGNQEVAGVKTFTNQVELSTANKGVLSNSEGAFTITKNRATAGDAILSLDISAESASLAEIRMFRTTNTSGTRRLLIYKGDGSSTVAHNIGANGTFVFNNNAEAIGATGARIRSLSTGTGTDMVVDANGYLLLKSSSRRYKMDIEDFDLQYAQNVIEKIRTVFYRLKDKQPSYPESWSYYGVIAEELAEIEPRLCTWGYWPEDYEEVTVMVDEEEVYEDEEGNQLTRKIKVPSITRELKKDAKLSPTGVQYDRLAVIAMRVQQADRERIKSLEERLASLEARI